MAKVRKALKVFALAVTPLLVIPQRASASEQKCVDAYKSWKDLPRIIDSEIPDVVRAALATSKPAQILKSRYGSNTDLHLILPGNAGGDNNGWGIQGEFLAKLLRVVFPEAMIESPPFATTDGVQIEIDDTAMVIRRKSHVVDMIDLKIANRTRVSQTQAEVRQMLRLPPDASIASVYYSYDQRSLDVAEVVGSIVEGGLADLVILSAQLVGSPSAIVSKRLTTTTSALVLSCETWENLDICPGRAVILNLTRGRMPYMHAAADYVVVLGQANVMEADRPTYFHHQPNGAIAAGWKRFRNAAVATGWGVPFTTNNELIDHLRTPTVRQIRETDVQPALDRIFGAILLAMERDQRLRGE